MTYIWNIYEPCDPTDIGDDPFDIFIFTLRRDDPPHVGGQLYVEGRNRRIVTCVPDRNLTDVNVFDGECYYKVCVVDRTGC